MTPLDCLSKRIFIGEKAKNFDTHLIFQSERQIAGPYDSENGNGVVKEQGRHGNYQDGPRQSVD